MTHLCDIPTAQKLRNIFFFKYKALDQTVV